ncbi:MAG: MMPL family transporter [Propionibacteriaceae bacterium]|nr:MMPL family transporter [Propionibacteriaceae bacterium]
MFEKLGHGVTRYPWFFLVFWVIVCSAAAGGAFFGFGHGGLFDRLENSMSLVPGSDSDQVDQLTNTSADGELITIVVNGVDMGSQASQTTAGQFMAANRDIFTTVKNVIQETDPFLLSAAPDPTLHQNAMTMISSQQNGFLISLVLDPALQADNERTARNETHDAVAVALDTFNIALAQQFPGSQATQISVALLGDSVIGQVQSDLVTGEAVSLPVALLLMIIVFGGVLAAGLPLIGALISIAVGLGAVWGLTFFITVDSFILNVISIIGVALSIDYGLLVVSRYREQLVIELDAAGYPSDRSRVPRKFAAQEIVRTATQKTIATAGRTVAFSALTIAFAMSALLTMQSSILKTMATAGIIVTLLAVLMALMVVPALIVIMNRVLIQRSVLSRIPGLRQISQALGDSASDQGFFSRLAHGVHKRPWLIMVAVLAILGVMAYPIGGLKMRTTFDDFLPPNQPTTIAYNTLQQNYPALRGASIVVIADEPPDSAIRLYSYLQTLADVDFVTPPAVLPDDANRTVISVHVDAVDQVGSQVTDLVKGLRTYDAGVPLLIGGPAALQYDFIQSVLNNAPRALIIMICAVLILLFLMTGSLVVPLKALIINSLSLIASLGTASFIFEHGLFGMPKVLGMETFIVVCGICFGFGLAMDYEVFLLARIKEYWDAGLTNDEAVEQGLQRSGRIITSAAAIIVAVFIGFTFGNMGAIKQVGVLLAITVITDATLVRLLLVPATMTVLGQWNWWAPAPLRTIYSKLKIIH